MLIIMCLVIIIVLLYFIYLYNTTSKYELVVGAVFKNESHILDEWIKHYKYHGVDHIYLVNDNSTDNFQEILDPYIKDNYVTLFNNTLKIDGYPRQKFIYKEYFMPIINRSKWWTIIDLDEFMYSPNEINLKKMIKQYEKYGQIFVRWVMFGSNNHIDQPKNVVMSFTKRKFDNSNMTGKTIFRSDLLNDFDVHQHKVNGELIIVNNIVINHYAIQSWSFFERVKMTRGDADNYINMIGIVRDRKYFDSYDYNEVDDLILYEQNKLIN